MSVTRVIVIYHTTNVCRIVPEVAKTLRMIIGFCVPEVEAVAQPSGKKGEAFSDVLRVGVHEGIRGNEAELIVTRNTASPATGKAIRLRYF